MVSVVKSHRGDVETPKKGKKVALAGSFTIRKAPLEALSKTVILRLLNPMRRKMKTIIDDGIRSTYKKSGLGIKSQRLLKQAMQYKVVLSFAGNRLTVKLNWESPSIDHFFIHLFGGIIRAKKAPFLVFQTDDGAWHKVKQVKIPRRNFLSFRANIRKKLDRQVIDPTLKDEIKKREKAKTKGRKPPASRGGGRKSKFRKRRG